MKPRPAGVPHSSRNGHYSGAHRLRCRSRETMCRWQVPAVTWRTNSPRRPSSETAGKTENETRNALAFDCLFDGAFVSRLYAKQEASLAPGPELRDKSHRDVQGVQWREKARRRLLKTRINRVAVLALGEACMSALHHAQARRNRRPRPKLGEWQRYRRLL